MELFLDFLRKYNFLLAECPAQNIEKTLKGHFSPALLSKKVFDSCFDPDEQMRMKRYELELIPLTHHNKKCVDKVIHQPFGTQMPPDFIVFTQTVSNVLHVAYIECKSSVHDKSVWNCRLPFPIPNAFYLHYTVSKKMLHVNCGNQLITHDLYQYFQTSLTKLRDVTDQINAQAPDAHFAFEVYPRQMYIQKSSYNTFLGPIPFLKYIYPKVLGEFGAVSHGSAALEQYFTPYSIVIHSLELLTKYRTVCTIKKILEPSSGNGQILDILSLVWPAATRLDHFEIDSALARKTGARCRDFLLEPIEEKYDLIIGNPPYSKLSSADREKYPSDLVMGSYNLYALFLEKCVRLLDDNGVLVFIIPPTLNTCPSFDRLRRWMLQRVAVKETLRLGNFSSDVAQEAQIFICQRLKEEKQEKEDKDENEEQKETQATKAKEESSASCSSDLCLFGVSVSSSSGVPLHSVANVVTGSIVWNEHKDKLSDTYQPAKNLRLIYSSDITADGTLIQSKPATSFVETNKKPLPLPVILATRSKKPRFALITQSEHPLIAENHVNVITSSTKSLSLLYKFLISDACSNYLREIGTSLNIGKNQLANLTVPDDVFL